MAGMDISKLKLGPIGDRVMYENELVRVWDFVVEPGKSKGWHRHELPYVIIPMTEGDIELESALTGEDRRADLAGCGRGPRSAERRQENVPKYPGRDQTARVELAEVRIATCAALTAIGCGRAAWRPDAWPFA
jgi:hypothetical protein